jgi:hypothetical protein
VREILGAVVIVEMAPTVLARAARALGLGVVEP